MVQQEYWAEMSRSFEVWEHIHVGMELSTVSLRGIEASDDRAVAGAINIASLVHGTVTYGGIRNSETAFLQLAAGEGSRYKMMSVIIPVAVWRQIAGTAEPGSFKGKVIEVQTKPQVVA